MEPEESTDVIFSRDFKGCPFCGDKIMRLVEKPVYFVMCCHCGACGPPYNSIDAALAGWDRRPTPGDADGLQMLIQANALNLPIKSESVQCVVTSPPYWGLRDYGTARWEGGDAECNHVVGPAVSAVSTLGGGKQPDVFMPFRGDCGKCGARRIDSQLGEKLVEPCILAGSRPGDVVLDPFAGSGTVVRVARQWQRRGVGCDISLAYLSEQAEERINSVQVEMFPSWEVTSRNGSNQASSCQLR